MGLRDTFREGLWWRSSLLCLGVLGLWFWLYFHYAKFFLSLSVYVSAVSTLGLFLGGAFSLGSGPATVSSMANVGPMIQALVMALAVALAIASFFYVMLFIVGVLTTLRLPLGWLLLKRAKSVVDKQYKVKAIEIQPSLPITRKGYILSALSILLTLCVPIWSFIVILRILLTLNISSAYRSVAKKTTTTADRRLLQDEQRHLILVMGIFIFLFMFIPLLNLLIPSLLFTSVAHLQQRAWTLSSYKKTLQKSDQPIPAENKASNRISVLYPYTEMAISHILALSILLDFTLYAHTAHHPWMDQLQNHLSKSIIFFHATSLIYGVYRITTLKFRGIKLYGYFFGAVLLPVVTLPYLFWSYLWPIRKDRIEDFGA